MFFIVRVLADRDSRGNWRAIPAGVSFTEEIARKSTGLQNKKKLEELRLSILNLG